MNNDSNKNGSNTMPNGKSQNNTGSVSNGDYISNNVPNQSNNGASTNVSANGTGDEKQRNVDANARAAQTGIKAGATAAGAALGGSAGAAVGNKVADVVNNSKIGKAAAQGIGKAMDKVNKVNPLGKQVQNATNKAADNGTFDKVDKGIDTGTNLASGGAGGAAKAAGGAGGAAKAAGSKAGRAAGSSNAGTKSGSNPSKAQGNKSFGKTMEDVQDLEDSVNKDSKDESAEDTSESNNKPANNGVGNKVAGKALSKIKIKILIKVLAIVLPYLLGFLLIFLVIIFIFILVSNIYGLLSDDETRCVHVPKCSTIIVGNGDRYTLNDYLNGAVYNYFKEYDDADIFKAMSIVVKSDLYSTARVNVDTAECTLTEHSDYPEVEVIDYSSENTSETTQEEIDAKAKYKKIVSATNSVKRKVISGYDMNSIIDPSVLDDVGFFEGYEKIAKAYLSVPEDEDELVWTVLGICEEDSCQSIPTCTTVVAGSVGTMTLDEFVEGVVMHEAGAWNNSEYFKAHAVVARSYVAGKYDQGDGTCVISDQDLVTGDEYDGVIGYKPNTNELITQAVADTSGQFILDGDEIHVSEWDAFCWKSKVNDKYTLFQQDQEIPVSWANEHVWNSNYLNNVCQQDSATPEDGGHGRGMSQYGAYYMTTAQGSSYEDVLSFYFPDSQIGCSAESSDGFINSDGYTSPLAPETVGSITGEKDGYCRSHSPHRGIDFAAASGTSVFATHAGTISRVYNYNGNCYMSCNSGNISFGNAVTIDHGDGTSSTYAHMSSFIVNLGDTVTAGQLIGYVGNTGNSSGAHLHFEMKANGVIVDPRLYVPLDEVGLVHCYGN